MFSNFVQNMELFRLKPRRWPVYLYLINHPLFCQLAFQYRYWIFRENVLQNLSNIKSRTWRCRREKIKYFPIAVLISFRLKSDLNVKSWHKQLWNWKYPGLYLTVLSWTFHFVMILYWSYSSNSYFFRCCIKFHARNSKFNVCVHKYLSVGKLRWLS